MPCSDVCTVQLLILLQYNPAAESWDRHRHSWKAEEGGQFDLATETNRVCNSPVKRLIFSMKGDLMRVQLSNTTHYAKYYS